MNHSTLNQLATQEKTRREILQRSELIPPLPDLVVRLLSVLNKQETEPRDLEDLMQNDQVLVAKMLAMVNSPFYGLSRTVSTIREAVMVLGFRGVRSLVLASSAAKFMQRDFSCYGHEPKGLWLHAACVASASRTLAKEAGFGLDESEQMFVGGLLHDIGKLLLVSYMNDAGCSVGAEEAAADIERKRFGLDHTEAGALVAAKWNLDASIQKVIKEHHDAQEAGEPTESKAVAVVRLADAIAHECGIGYLPERVPAVDVRPRDLAALGIAEDRWSTLRDEIAVAMDEAVSSLKNLGS